MMAPLKAGPFFLGCFASLSDSITVGIDHKKIGDGDIPIYGSGGIMRYGDKFLYDGETVLIPRKGLLNNIMYFNGKVWTVDTMFYTKMLLSDTNQLFSPVSAIFFFLANERKTGGKVREKTYFVIDQ